MNKGKIWELQTGKKSKTSEQFTKIMIALKKSIENKISPRKLKIWLL